MSQWSSMAALIPSVTRPLSPTEDDELVAALSELGLPEDQILGPEPDDADDVGTTLFESSRLGIDWRHAQSATHADHLLGVADPARHAHGPDHAVEQASGPADLLHFPGRLADRLHDQCDRAGGRIKIRDRQRDALAMLVDQDDDELARSGRLRHRRVPDFQQECHIREIFPGNDLETGDVCQPGPWLGKSWAPVGLGPKLIVPT
jgi:hypothetical protein